MANTLELIGTLYRKMDAQRISEKFEKREFVIETEEQYTQLVKFELVNERCTFIDKFNPGDKLKVSFDVRGRDWKRDDGTIAYFVSLNAWRVDYIGAGTQPPASTHSQAPAVVSEPEEMPIGADSDLPF